MGHCRESSPGALDKSHRLAYNTEMKWLLFLCVLSGCATKDRFDLGPKLSEQSSSVLVVDYTGRFSKYVGTIRSGVYWEEKYGGLERKNIEVKILGRSPTSAVKGRAVLGGERISLYLYDETTEDVIAHLFHEIDHLRGKEHESMPSLDTYRKRARTFLKL